MENPNTNTHTSQEIINRIDEHLTKSGREYYSDFFVGITNDINKVLFHKHHVSYDRGWWAYMTANSPDEAYKVWTHYKNMGMRSSKVNHEDGSSIVYCYAVTPYTVESWKE